MKQIIVLLQLLIALVISGCSDNNVDEPDPKVVAGRELFRENCAECHPRTGRGDYLKRIPATVISRRSDYELMKWIEGSDKHREMPNFDHLSNEERASLAAYIYSETTGKKPY